MSRRSKVRCFQRLFSPSHTKFWCLMRSTHPVLPSNERRRAATCHGVRKECYSEVGEKTAIFNSSTAPIYKDVLIKIQPELAVAPLSFEKLWFQTSVRHFHHIKRHVKETNYSSSKEADRVRRTTQNMMSIKMDRWRKICGCRNGKWRSTGSMAQHLSYSMPVLAIVF